MICLKQSRNNVRHNYLADEAALLDQLVKEAALGEAERSEVVSHAIRLIEAVRRVDDPGIMEEFLAEYGLSTREGVALMCLAEAHLRVPDAETVDELIQDKIVPHDWGAHLGEASSSLVNASTWALMLTGRVLDEQGQPGLASSLRNLVRRLGEPVVRVAVGRAMREMGAQFVLGRTIGEALTRGDKYTRKGYTYSYDMLGEAARTEADAHCYHQAYAQAIAQLGEAARHDHIADNPGISVKLSALHPRYEFAQRKTVVPVLVERTLDLARAAAAHKMGFNIDAEEADRLDLSLDIIENILEDPSLAAWDGFGVVVQAYGRRASPVIDWLYCLAQKLDRKIMVRLVKGAYWDSEIKRAQTLGLSSFPVFTRKASTDISYVACARKLLSYRDRIYPQFATHNAHSCAAILKLVEISGDSSRESFEFQRLHGMGEVLHDVLGQEAATRCRIYAPVGDHRDLLAYLVRRLLENGANSSFVHQIVNEEVSPKEIARDPFATASKYDQAAHPSISTPSAIFEPLRRNSKGWDITDPLTVDALEQARMAFRHHQWQAGPNGTDSSDRLGTARCNPTDPSDMIGEVVDALPAEIDRALVQARDAFRHWADRPAYDRAAILIRAASYYEANTAELLELACREAGKSWLDGVAEIREAVDFLYYYAAKAEAACDNTEARGIIVCISPWNFPLAIFTGQIAAALATGNSVLAKPAEQTPLIAARAVSLLHEAGVPNDVLQLLPGDGPNVGASLVAHPDVAGVAFTGSIEVARLIDRQLAKTAAPNAALIAETGGINAMIVDSTALPEQAVRDILASAFQSAGQRCSALRMLYVQKDVEPRLLEMLQGAMETLVVGDPKELSTDIGPVIDAEAQYTILDYCRQCEREGRLLKRIDAPAKGLFVGPHLIRVGGIEGIPREIFGPVLHVASFEADDIDRVVEAINAKGYGLTFGLHTRIDSRVQHILDRIHVGNAYINRNQIGAIVGSQPFGGEGLSGTGPKAGGPHYLRRFRKSPLDEGMAPNPERVSEGAVLEAIAQARKTIDTISKAVELPGPTGESNRLRHVPRGVVLCVARDWDMIESHARSANSMGNGVVVVCDGIPQGVSEIQLLKGSLDADLLTRLPIDAVTAAGPREWLQTLRQALSARDGKIIPLITERDNPEAFVLERAVCVDTTAAGGNASLLAQTS